MALKPTLSTIEDLDPAIAALYKEDDGKYVLEVEGLVPADKLEEFRSNNRELFTAKTALEDENRAYKERMAELEAAASDGKKKAEEATTLSQRIAALEDANRKKDEALAAAERRRVEDGFRNDLKRAGLENGVDPKAVDDWTASAIREWEIGPDGTAKRVKDGQPIMSDEVPGRFQTPDEFARSWAEVKPFYYKPSRGDGATGAEPGPGVRRISRSDSVAIGKYAEDITAGKAIVVDG